MRNYYDELEINKNASKEVIERVYKVLAKKYHPDTTTEPDKAAAEEKFKMISEAYEILSNDEKRKKYDFELEQYNPTVSYDDYLNLVNQRDALNNSLSKLKTELQNKNNNNINNNSNNYNTNMNYQNPPIYNNHSYNTNTNFSNQKNNHKSSKKVKYYDTLTGRPVSSITYYIYKIKQFISNLFYFLLIVIMLILLISSLLNNPPSISL